MMTEFPREEANISQKHMKGTCILLSSSFQVHEAMVSKNSTGSFKPKSLYCSTRGGMGVG